MKRIFTVLLIVMMVFISCEQDNITTTGELTVSVGDTSSRGLKPNVDMTPSAYRIELSSDGKETITQELRGTETSKTFTLDAGEWTVYVEAYSGDVFIGSGSKTCTVKAGASSTCNVHVTEKHGDGTFRVMAYGNIPAGTKVVVYGTDMSSGVPVESVIAEKVLTSSNTSDASIYIKVPSGTYIVRIISDETVLKEETARIVAGMTTFWQTTFNAPLADGTINVQIENCIKPDPVITLGGAKAGAIAPNSSYVISAVIDNIDSPYVEWLVNGKLIPDNHTLSLSGTAPSEGKLTVTCRAYSGNTVWSETKEFGVTDKSFEGKWLVKSQPDEYFKECFVLDMHDGHMVYDRYGARDRAMIGLESDYTVTKIGSDYRIDFNWFSPSHQYHFIIPGTMDGTARLGFDTVGENCNVTFEAVETAPVFETKYIDYNAVKHMKVAVIPGLGEYKFDDCPYEEHTFVNGVCSVCGYDQSKPIYEVCDDFSIVTDQIGQIDVCRYWPGSLTLHDGTVVNDTDQFYFRKWYGGNTNRYVIYIPYTLCEFYETNNGYRSYDAEHVLDWFVVNVLGYEKGLYEGPYNDGLEVLFAGEASMKNIDPALVTSKVSERMVAYDDPAKLPETYSDWVDFEAYTGNELMREDGTPIPETGKVWIRVDESGMLYIYYPAIVRETYEKGDGCNPGSGNPFWFYLNTYYPELRNGNQDDWLEIARTLLTHEWIDPRPEDVDKRYNI